MNEKTEIKQDVCNFLQDEDFIRWRLFQTKESGDYWLTFRIEHPHLEEALLEAIRQFSSVEINKHHLHTYTGKFRQSDGVDYALRVLQKSIHFRYSRDEETGIIYIK